MNKTEKMYVEAIESSGAPLDGCVVFMDGTKIQMKRPGGNESLQRYA